MCTTHSVFVYKRVLTLVELDEELISCVLQLSKTGREGVEERKGGRRVKGREGGERKGGREGGGERKGREERG